MLNAYIENQQWPAKRGLSRPTLVITYKALLDILQEESACIDPDDVPGLLKAIAERCREAGGPNDQTALNAWLTRADDDVIAVSETDNDEHSPECSLVMAALFAAEVHNKKTYDSIHPCTLADVRASLQQMPDDVLVPLLFDRLKDENGCVINTDDDVLLDLEAFRDGFDRKDFEHELDELISWCGIDHEVLDLLKG